MRRIYVAVAEASPVMAFEDKDDADALAGKLGGYVVDVMFAEMDLGKRLRLGSLTDEDFAD